LVEAGAGRGLLMYDILNSLLNLVKKNQILALEFLKNTTFHIIEINEELIKIQQQKLQEFSKIINLKFHENFSDFLSENNSQIYFLSNELFDCFAIDQFVKTNQGWCKRLMEFDDYENFKNPRFTLDLFNEEIDQFVVNELQNNPNKNPYPPINAVFEYSKDARNFMNQLCEALKFHGGIAINCDYGYYHYDFANSLQGIKNHQKLDFIDSLIECDITALVDFFALDKIAKNFNLQTSLISQRQFLLELGAFERSQQLITKNPSMSQEIASSLERLTSPLEMGELFKFHIIW
jgi:SAM-dependent MidA family methyltransferase